MPAESAQQALSILRHTDRFVWYVIPLLVIVIYIYSVEIEKRNWNVLFAGLALWGMDWFNEIWNALLFHFNGYAPAWGAPGDTAYLILIGLNIEICLMFAVLGLAMAKMLPADKNLKILGIPNRWFFAVLNSWLAIGIEMVLNALGVLTWEHSWWRMNNPWLLFLIGYLPFFVVAFWVHDMKTVKQKAITVGALLGFDAACLVVFIGILKWI